METVILILNWEFQTFCNVLCMQLAIFIALWWGLSIIINQRIHRKHYQWHMLVLWRVNFLIGLSIQETIPVAWVNTTLFDYEGKLRQGPLTLFAWPVPETMADQLNPVGTVVSNIDTVTSVSLDLEFQGYSNVVVYPSVDTVNCVFIINFIYCRWNLVY